MAIDIKSQTVNAAFAAGQQVSVSKESPVEKPEGKAVPIVETPKEVVKQATEIPEKAESPGKPIELPRETIQEAVNKLQDYVDKYDRDLKFSIDDDTGRTVVRLLDADSNVVKQYPSEDILSLISNLEQNKGLFIGEA